MKQRKMPGRRPRAADNRGGCRFRHVRSGRAQRRSENGTFQRRLSPTCRPDDPDSPDLTSSQLPSPAPSRKPQVAVMTVQVGAALGFLVIRRAGSIPGAVVGYSNPFPRPPLLVFLTARCAPEVALLQLARGAADFADPNRFIRGCLNRRVHVGREGPPCTRPRRARTLLPSSSESGRFRRRWTRPCPRISQLDRAQRFKEDFPAWIVGNLSLIHI